MAKPKVDVRILNQMLESGKSVKQCAKFFGVTPGAISQHKKNLHVGVVKNICMENAARVVDKNLNAVEQLQKINGYANEILDLLMRWNRGDDEALQILETQVSMKKVRVGDQEEFVKEFKFGDPRFLALKAMAEIRNQLKLQLDIFQCLYDLKAVQEFQEEVLDTIKRVDKNVRNEIINRLIKSRALYKTLKFD